MQASCRTVCPPHTIQGAQYSQGRNQSCFLCDLSRTLSSVQLGQRTECFPESSKTEASLIICSELLQRWSHHWAQWWKQGRQVHYQWCHHSPYQSFQHLVESVCYGETGDTRHPAGPLPPWGWWAAPRLTNATSHHPQLNDWQCGYHQSQWSPQKVSVPSSAGSAGDREKVLVQCERFGTQHNRIYLPPPLLSKYLVQGMQRNNPHWAGCSVDHIKKPPLLVKLLISVRHCSKQWQNSHPREYVKVFKEQAFYFIYMTASSLPRFGRFGNVQALRSVTTLLFRQGRLEQGLIRSTVSHFLNTEQLNPEVFIITNPWWSPITSPLK